MQRNRALTILGLEPEALQEDAKKAYRRLAKLCHPDVASASSKKMLLQECSMEDINWAFNFIFPLLPPKSEIKKTAPTQSTEPQEGLKESFEKPETAVDQFFSFFKRLFQEFFFKSKNKFYSSSQSMHQVAKVRPQSKDVRQAGFDSMLDEAHQKAACANESHRRRQRGKSRLCRTRPFRHYYTKYAMFKRKTGNAPGRGTGTVVGPVEPVSPVSKVKRI